MSPSSRRLTPQQIANDPELAMLAALDAVLELSVPSLFAQHQDIGHDDQPDRLTTLAVSIITSAEELRVLLRGYRVALARRYRDIPF